MTTTQTTMKRRDFLKVSATAAGALALEFCLPVATARAAPQAGVTEVNAWIVIHPDDRVVIRIARSEMGQGTFTALAQLVAEELDCDWAKVSAEFASPNEHIRRNRIWGSMSTGGSMGVRTSQDYVRKAGASARAMLVGAAGRRWNVPASLPTHRPASSCAMANWRPRLRRFRPPRTSSCAIRRTGRSPASRCIASTSPTR